MSAIDEHIKMISDTIMNCKIGELEMALKDLGISLRNKDGEYKTIGEVFSELHDKTEKLADETYMVGRCSLYPNTPRCFSYKLDESEDFAHCLAEDCEFKVKI